MTAASAASNSNQAGRKNHSEAIKPDTLYQPQTAKDRTGGSTSGSILSI
jgi:hypothetical protein